MLNIRPSRFNLIALLVCEFCTVQVCADDVAQRAQAIIDRGLTDAGLPAVTAGIAKDGQIIWVGASGFMDLDKNERATPDMIHRLASVSKPMTAVAAMQLVALGKLDLEAPLQRYVPAWPAKAEGEVLIWHLLSHTSGVRHYAGRENRPMEHYESLVAAMNVFKDRPLAFAPGDQYLYTTYGYTALGAAIETACGERYVDYMRAHVWGPAGMEHTSLEVNGVAIANKAKLYRRSAEGFAPDAYDDASVRYPGGGIQSTAADLLRFAIAFENGTLLSAESRERMQAIPAVKSLPANGRRTPYALGWMIYESGEFGKFLNHDGGQSGTSTNLSIYPEHDVAIAVLCNLQDAGVAARDLTIALARIAIGQPHLQGTAAN